MTRRRSKRELESAVDKLTDDAGDIAEDVDLTGTQAKAIREYTLHCDHPSELDDDLEAALLEVVDDA